MGLHSLRLVSNSVDIISPLSLSESGGDNCYIVTTIKDTM